MAMSWWQTSHSTYRWCSCALLASKHAATDGVNKPCHLWLLYLTAWTTRTASHGHVAAAGSGRSPLSSMVIGDLWILTPRKKSAELIMAIKRSPLKRPWRNAHRAHEATPHGVGKRKDGATTYLLRARTWDARLGRDRPLKQGNKAPGFSSNTMKSLHLRLDPWWQ